MGLMRGLKMFLCLFVFDTGPRHENYKSLNSYPGSVVRGMEFCINTTTVISLRFVHVNSLFSFKIVCFVWDPS